MHIFCRDHRDKTILEKPHQNPFDINKSHIALNLSILNRKSNEAKYETLGIGVLFVWRHNKDENSDGLDLVIEAGSSSIEEMDNCVPLGTQPYLF